MGVFWPLGNTKVYFYLIFESWYFGFVLKLEISYRVIISWSYNFQCFWRSFWRLYFCMVKYLSCHDSSFALRYFWMWMARPWCDTLLVSCGCNTCMHLGSQFTNLPIPKFPMFCNPKYHYGSFTFYQVWIFSDLTLE